MTEHEPESSSSRHRHHRSSHSDEHKSKKKHSRDADDVDGHSSKRSKHRDDRHSEGKKKKHRSKKGTHDEGMTVVDAADDEGVWVEKNISEDGQRPLATDIPTADSLNLTSHASGPSSASLPPSRPAEAQLKRDDWMLMDPGVPTIPSSSDAAPKRALPAPSNESLTEDYGDPTTDSRTSSGGVDFFSSLGTEHRKKQKPDMPDPSKLVVSSRELNTQLKEGKSLDEYVTPSPAASKPNVPGGPGSGWRMKKLQRTYELAEEEERTVEDLARERYDSLEEFNAALDERRVLDEREQRRTGRSTPATTPARLNPSGEVRYMFTDLNNPDSRPSSRNSFRRPGDTAPSTPNAGSGTPTAPANRRVDSLRLGRTQSGSTSPIPSVLPPTPTPAAGGKPPMSTSELNKLQARVLKAKLMGAPNADALEKQFETEKVRAAAGAGAHIQADGTRVEMVPTVDARGRLYDVGSGKQDVASLPGNRRQKPTKVETRDPKTGEMLRYNEDDDSTTLGDMLRHERFGGGMADQKNLDAELAGAIMGDGKFQDDLEYMDDNADKLGRKKMRSDAMKRQFAINDYARTAKAMASCQFCYGEDDSPPKAGVIAMGTRAYLSCTLNEELVDGHCYIVPIQHHLSMLEADDDVWDEVRNFMKCLIRMAGDAQKGYFFYETVISLKWQKHTVIECVPVPFAQFDDLPAYFKESILASEAEWSQHKKLIDFSARPGGFRRAMVPNLPYFMVQWDYKGEKGYGHVIEGTGDSAGGGEGDGAVDEGDKGGGEFPRYFAAEIIGNVLELESRQWRRPRRIDLRLNHDRVTAFKKSYSKYDWTGLIGQS